MCPAFWSSSSAWDSPIAATNLSGPGETPDHRPSFLNAVAAASTCGFVHFLAREAHLPHSFTSLSSPFSLWETGDCLTFRWVLYSPQHLLKNLLGPLISLLWTLWFPEQPGQHHTEFVRNIVSGSPPVLLNQKLNPKWLVHTKFKQHCFPTMAIYIFSMKAIPF